MRHEPDRAFQTGDRKQFLQRAASTSIENGRRRKLIVLRSSGYFQFHYIFLSLNDISKFGQNMKEVFLLAIERSIASKNCSILSQTPPSNSFCFLI